MDSTANHEEEGRIQTIHAATTTFLDTPPSCLEFSPASPEYLVVGTYKLELKKPGAAGNQSEGEDLGPDIGKQDRSGNLSIFRLHGDDLNLVRTIPTACAVLDLHFAPHDPDILAVAGSTGVILLYRLDPQNLNNLNNFSCLQLYPSSTLILSLAWHPSPEKRSTIALSLSDGQVAILDHEDQSPEATLKSVQAHDLEAWTVAWSPSIPANGTSVLYSGGDDSALCKDDADSWPFRSTASKDISQDQLLSSDRKTHGAGVTAILPIESVAGGDEDVLVTGSYDESIRVLVLPSGRRRSRLLAEKRLGGGVWRLKRLETKLMDEDAEVKLRVLASCMHAGARVLEIRRSREGNWAINVLAKFEEHKSMNYASDAQPTSNGNGTNVTTIVSSSFYDRKLCVWRINDD